MTVLLNINDYKNEAAILVPSKNILEDQAGAKYVYILETVTGHEGMYKAIKTFVKTVKILKIKQKSSRVYLLEIK